jgi:hypothetical protein
VEGTCEQNEHRENLKTNFTLSAKRTKVKRKYNEQMGGKYETITGDLA